MEDSDQVIEGAEEPAAGVFVGLHQGVHALQTFLRALHLHTNMFGLNAEAPPKHTPLTWPR